MKSRGPRVVSASDISARSWAEESTLHVGAFSHIPEVLRSLGEDPAEVCAAAGFDVALFDDPSSQVSFRTATHLFKVCAERTGCAHVGLLIGQHSGLDSLGFVGLLVKYSKDVRTALRTLVRHMHLHIRGAVTTLKENDKLAMFTYEVYAPGAEATHQIGDAALGTMFNTLAALCGPHWKPIEVRFEHRRPSDLAPYHRFFQAPLRFQMDSNALVFAASWLDRPLAEVDPELIRLLRDKTEELEAQYRNRFPDVVRGILRSAVLTGHGTAEYVASLLSMHSRTLHRHLTESDTNFRALVDDCRYEIARQMLGDTDHDVGQIAYMLGYADTSAFARAFRRWSGSTPTGWRTRDHQRRPL
jgi:AraC-like DNA-binding protein